MIFPPTIMRLYVRNANGKEFFLWLPLFLLWPLVLALFLVVTPLLFVFDLVMYLGGLPFHFSTALLWRSAALFCHCRGMRIHVQSKTSESVQMDFW